MKVFLTTLNAKYTHSSLALRYLREYCRELPCSMELQEFTINQQPLDILGQIYEERPDLVAFSCSIWNIEQTMRLVRLLKQVMPQTVIVCGGPEVSYDAAVLMMRQAQVDYLIGGEGEETFYSLLEALESGETRPKLSALTYREPSGALHVGQVALVEALALIPFPYREEEMARLRDRIIYYESARGCPFSCQYCLSSATRGVRFFPLARVIDELRFFIRHQVRQVKFVDRTFNAKKEHYLAIWRFLARQDCATNFHFEIAVDLLDEEALLVLRAMPKGRIQLEIGVQSTNPATLQEIRRKNHWDKITRNVGALRELGTMHLHLDLIIGLPQEDYASFARSFNDVYDLRPHMLQLGFLKLLKGSGIAANAAEGGYAFMEEAPYQVLQNRWISYGEIRFLQLFEEVFEQYYNAGRFRAATDYLIGLFDGDAFAFYERLTSFWRARGLHLAAHAVKELYELLFSFCQAHCREECSAIADLLKLDALSSDQGRVLPDFLPWSEQAHYEEISAFWRGKRVKSYLPSYQFTNWRALKKQYRLEIFDFSVCRWQEGGALRKEKEFAVFHYTEEGVSCRRIRPEDFWGKEDIADDL